MVLEGIISPIKAEKKPWKVFFLGFAYPCVAIIISFLIFKDQASISSVFLASILSIPLVYGTIKLEENKDLNIDCETTLIKEHSRFISLVTFLFIGLVISFSVWYVFLPTNTTENLFNLQITSIKQINAHITGDFFHAAPILEKILTNNLKVLFFCLIFSFIFGFGAIYILTWNASVVGAAIGDLVTRTTSQNYLTIFTMGFLSFAVHGIPEMIAYFIAGLAGGIISRGIVKHDFRSKKFRHLLIDSSYLVLLSVFTLFVAGLLEVFVTPLLFS